MKIRLALFTAALLLLPPLGVWLAGESDLFVLDPGPVTAPGATWLTAPGLAGLLAITNAWLARRQGHDLLRLQRRYYLMLALAGAALGGLLLWLNHFAASGWSPGGLDTITLLGDGLLFALLLPAVLMLRALLASFPLLLRAAARGPALPPLPHDLSSALLLLVASGGLLAGAAWPQMLFWLFWLAPLLLLMALQQLWHEDTIFSGVAQGDWSRPLLAALAGLIAGNLTLTVFRVAGGELLWQLPHPSFVQLGLAAYGLLCLQLGDVIAGFFRGKTRADLFKQKTFPIPVVSKK